MASGMPGISSLIGARLCRAVNTSMGCCCMFSANPSNGVLNMWPKLYVPALHAEHEIRTLLRKGLVPSRVFKYDPALLSRSY